MQDISLRIFPYKWMTIGKELSHIENATLSDVKNFFFKHYCPINAVLVVAGNIKTAQVKELAEKWFGDIPSGEKYERNLPKEPAQNEARKLEVKADVPIDMLIKAYHMASRTEDGYYFAELMSEVLGSGNSSRLYQSLVKEKKLFSSIDCHHTGSSDAGLLVIEGRLIKGVDIKDADKAVEDEINKFTAKLIEEKELIKVKNKTEAAIVFEDMSLMNRAASLAIYELLGDANMMNTELGKYQSVTAEQILEESRKIFDEKNSNTLYYLSNN